MMSGIDKVKIKTGAKIVDVRCPNNIIMYQQNMGGVDCGDRHRLMGAGFANISHLKNVIRKYN